MPFYFIVCVKAGNDRGECKTVTRLDQLDLNGKRGKLSDKKVWDLKIDMNFPTENFHGFSDIGDGSGIWVINHPKGRLHLTKNTDPMESTFIVVFHGKDKGGNDQYTYAYLSNNDECWLWYNQYKMVGAKAALLVPY